MLLFKKQQPNIFVIKDTILKIKNLYSSPYPTMFFSSKDTLCHYSFLGDFESDMLTYSKRSRKKALNETICELPTPKGVGF